jgi:hypothetical protein
VSVHLTSFLDFFQGVCFTRSVLAPGEERTRYRLLFYRVPFIMYHLNSVFVLRNGENDGVFVRWLPEASNSSGSKPFLLFFQQVLS